MRAQLEIVNSPGVLDAVREHAVPLGFVEGLDDLKGLESLTVARDEIVVVVAGDHRWSSRNAIDPEQLRGEPYFTREAESGTRAVAHAALARAGIELEPALETASLQSVKRALSGGGFSLLSALAIEAEERAGTLRSLQVRDADLVRELRAVRDPRVPFSGVARRFWGWLRAHRGDRVGPR